MIFCRFITSEGGDARYGLIDQHQIQEISPDPFSSYEPVGDPVALQEVRLINPVTPSKIVAVGVNYRKHAEEMKHDIPKEPLLFLKPASAVIGPQDSIRCPKMSARVDYEGELAAVIGRRASKLSPQEALSAVLGYTCFNDVTARDLQQKDSQWSRAKGFDTFAPVGPWIVTDLDPTDLSLQTYVNGELKQNSSTKDMIVPVAELISYVSQIMTLEPGDIVTTGTPSGIGPLKPGDMVDVRIDGIGVLRNFVEEGS